MANQQVLLQWTIRVHLLLFLHPVNVCSFSWLQVRLPYPSFWLSLFSYANPEWISVYFSLQSLTKWLDDKAMKALYDFRASAAVFIAKQHRFMSERFTNCRWCVGLLKFEILLVPLFQTAFKILAQSIGMYEGEGQREGWWEKVLILQYLIMFLWDSIFFPEDPFKWRTPMLLYPQKTLS